MRGRLALAGFLFLPLIAGAQRAAPEQESIRREDLRADLFFLASDALAGRLTDTAENRVAAEFLRARFERLGLKPMGPNGSYFQPFGLSVPALGPENLLVVRTSGAAELRLRPGEDFYPQRFSASGRARGSLVFAGFGISAPELGYDDYRDSEAVRDRIVLVLDHEPGEDDPASPFDGVVTSEAASALRKALTAQARGAAGILFVTDVHNHPGPDNVAGAFAATWPSTPPRIRPFLLGAWVEQVRIPAAQISRALAETLLRPTGRSLEALARASETPRGRAAVPVPGVEVDLSVSVARRTIIERNVVAALEGADPKLKDEWILIGAHFDHNGAEGDRIFNGADDNGSGTVGLLELAEAYALAANAGARPRRSILFAAWNAEERGLLGAWAFTEQPLVPLDSIAAVLNLDMIGRREEVPQGGGARFRGLEVQTADANRNAVNIVGYSRSPDLKAAVEQANRLVGLELRYRYDNSVSNLLRRSDHWPFLQRRVPAVWFFTGLHPDYHTVDDDPERIDYEKLEKVVRLVYQVSWDLAQQARRPTMKTPPAY